MKNKSWTILILAVNFQRKTPKMEKLKQTSFRKVLGEPSKFILTFFINFLPQNLNGRILDHKNTENALFGRKSPHSDLATGN